MLLLLPKFTEFIASMPGVIVQNSPTRLHVLCDREIVKQFFAILKHQPHLLSSKNQIKDQGVKHSPLSNKSVTVINIYLIYFNSFLKLIPDPVIR